MSLVAYGASDDSGASDSEDSDQIPDKQEEKAKDHISDDEEYEAVSSSTTTAVFSDFPLNNTLSLFTSHQGLPPPQKREEIAVEETELEDEVRQKPSELADAPKPPPKTTKQPVKITIPSLSEISDEDDASNRKKISSSSSSSAPSGLFALLPAPIHSSKKEINRPLIPHSLSKKLAPKKTPIQAKFVSSSSLVEDSNKSRTPLESKKDGGNSLIGYDSDSDEDKEETSTSQNFFSLGSGKETVPLSSSNDIEESCVIVKAATEKGKIENSESEEKPSSPMEQEVVASPEPGLSNDSPLDFANASKFSSWSSASSSYLGGWRPSSDQSQTASASSSTYPMSNVQYNMVDAEVSNEEDFGGDLQQVMNDREFQRFQGKRKRGMEEAISFIDAKVDDYVDPSELSKHITEETEYTSTKNKDDMPTSQQKRKKQITYLAFQAKEKEMELKNTWSQNRMTKRQTQAKYGF